MPRETVHDQSGLYDVKVGWSPGQYVQVGVETADHSTIASRIIEVSGPATFGPETEVQPPSMLQVHGGTAAAFTGLWGTFDREGCNRLIRVLRQARDKAYGRDE